MVAGNPRKASNDNNSSGRNRLAVPVQMKHQQLSPTVQDGETRSPGDSPVESDMHQSPLRRKQSPRGFVMNRSPKIKLARRWAAETANAKKSTC
ncbi:unnamed protein product [Linum trigynum]|uniref:Uncharacterized protein n=1 Tax=Linum trigynum TaxID=586398 RepID=A0AAV2CDL3_9ROSI